MLHLGWNISDLKTTCYKANNNQACPSKKLYGVRLKDNPMAPILVYGCVTLLTGILSLHISPETRKISRNRTVF